MIDYGVAVVTGWTAARAALIVPLAILAGGTIASELRHSTWFARRILWVAIITIIISPDLVAGYAYSNFSLTLARAPVANEILVAFVMAMKAMSVSAAIIYLAPPPPLAPSGRYLLSLLGNRPSIIDRILVTLRGRFISYFPAAAIAFLFVFQQFELPSLTNTAAWTVTLFDRQALLPDLSEATDPLVSPLLVEFFVLVPLLAYVLRTRSTRRARPEEFAVHARSFRWLSKALVVIGFATTIVVPFGILFRDAVHGFDFFISINPAAFGFWRQVGAALLFGLSSAICAYLAGSGLLKLARHPSLRTLGIVLLVAMCLPGLCGPLVPSLFTVDLLQTSWLLRLRETPLPVIAVLTLYLLPRAVLLESLSVLVRDLPGLHLANVLTNASSSNQSLSGRALHWQLLGFGRYCRVSLLAYWGYLDLTASTMLAPMGMESVTVWLYNFMHYGRNASLSAMTLVAMAVPIVLFTLILVLRHLTHRVLVR